MVQGETGRNGDFALPNGVLNWSTVGLLCNYNLHVEQREHEDHVELVTHKAGNGRDKLKVTAALHGYLISSVEPGIEI